LDASGEVGNEGRQATGDTSSPLMLLCGGRQLPRGAFEGNREIEELDWRGRRPCGGGIDGKLGSVGWNGGSWSKISELIH
jgi:hypothetical protein